MKKLTLLFALLFFSVQPFAQDLQQKMDDLLTAYAKDYKFNGSVLVAQKGNILFQKGYGYRNTEQETKHDATSIFQIGSITKQITAAVIVQLQEEGKLSVKDKLSKYYPDYPNGDKITIEHLLTHTSGIYNYTNDAELMRSDVTRHYTEEQMLATFKNKPLDFEPGTKWNYSNSAYSLLGYIIQKVTGKPYEKAVRERIFESLGMTESGFDFTHLKNDRKAKGYFVLNGERSNGAPIVDSTIAYSAGAIYSTVSDLYKWERAIYTDKILKPDSWKNVFTPYKNKYGYGWGIDSLYGRQFTAHSGGIHGFASYLIRFPQDELVVIMLDNASSPALSKIAKALAAIVYNRPYELPKVRKEIKLDAKILQQYVGAYEFTPNFIITVTLEGTQLKGQATGQPAAELYPERENFFFLKVVDAQIEFVKDENGKVTGMTLYQNGMQPKAKKIK